MALDFSTAVLGTEDSGAMLSKFSGEMLECYMPTTIVSYESRIKTL